MANRSKKVVISARIDPYLKAAIDTAAAAQNEKIVIVLESLIVDGLNEFFVPNPFRGGDGGEGGHANFMCVFEAIWSEDEVLFKLRAGAVGAEFAGDTAWRQARVVLASDYFKGDYDLFGDLNGLTPKDGSVIETYLIDFELVKNEWPLIEGYVAFLENNKALAPSYDDYKKMIVPPGAK